MLSPSSCGYELWEIPVPVSANSWTSTTALWPTILRTLRAGRPIHQRSPLRVNLHLPGVRSKCHTPLSAMM
ncbi:hypothetical protein MRX96_016527 [Rhipicephalus microplus]